MGCPFEFDCPAEIPSGNQIPLQKRQAREEEQHDASPVHVSTVNGSFSRCRPRFHVNFFSFCRNTLLTSTANTPGLQAACELHGDRAIEAQHAVLNSFTPVTPLWGEIMFIRRKMVRLFL